MEINSRTGLRLTLAAAGLAFMTGCVASTESDLGSAEAARAVAADRAAGEEGKAHKAFVCHKPPGNPANMHTLHVGEAAVKAHLAHGDALGACGDGGGDDTGVDTVDTGSGSS